MARWIITLLLAFGLGCGGGTSSAARDPSAGDEDEAHEHDDEPHPTSHASVDPTVTNAALDGAPLRIPPLVLRPLDDVAEAEDGEGHVVRAERAVAFEVDARLVPRRADGSPLILHVGDLVLERPETPRPGILRFILADRARVREGAPVTIQYGDSDATVVVVDPVLHLTW